MPGERRLYGVHPVSAWVRSCPTHLNAIYYDAQAGARLAVLLEMARAAGVRVQPTSDQMLAGLAGTVRHQGLVAAAKGFPYVGLEQVLAAAARLLVVGDQMQDPHNLGALLRTVEAVGGGAVILPKDGAAMITAAVESAAAGAAALVPVCRVTNTARTLRALKEAGYWVIGLVPDGGANLYDADIPGRVAVVVGGEAGMRALVARQCDLLVSIPMVGRIEALNASVAAAVVLYELLRRWRSEADTPRGRGDKGSGSSLGSS